MFLSSKTLDDTYFNLREEWYGIDYQVTKYTPEQLSFMRNAVVQEGKAFAFPPIN